MTVSPTPDEVDFWASGRVIATDKSAPFETPLDLQPGDYKLGFCHRKDRAQKSRPPSPGTEPGSSREVTIAEPSAPASTWWHDDDHSDAGADHDHADLADADDDYIDVDADGWEFDHLARAERFLCTEARSSDRRYGR